MSLNKACVILGAGASNDVAGKASQILDRDFKPPLAKDLFDIENNQAYLNVMTVYNGARFLSQDLAGWVLKDIDEEYQSFTFPAYILEPGAIIRVYTNEIHPEWGGFSFGNGSAVWNNSDPDVAALFDAQGVEVSRKSY